MRNSDYVGVSFLTLIVMLSMTLLGACSTLKNSSEPIASVSFDEYRNKMLAQIRDQRRFQTSDETAELFWNAPQEWRPVRTNAKPEKGILLVHGLGDSPWSFHDIAERLVHQGFLVRTVLLPGHGTQPENILNVTAEDWQKIVNEQARALEKDVKEVYLGGFSTGANLVLHYAYSHPDIAGLILFSPGFKSFSLDWLAPVIKPVRPWLVKRDGLFPMQTTVRYMNVPTNGFAQFYRTSAAARKLLVRTYEKPVFMVVAQHDSVLNTTYLLDVFQHRFTNPKSRLVWYGTKPDGLTDTRRIFIKEDRLPEQRISQFSHMGLLFSPDNPLYGRKGSLRMCLNGQANDMEQVCLKGGDVWYSDWGHQEEGKAHARLTFNPYFDWQTSIMLATLSNK